MPYKFWADKLMQVKCNPFECYITCIEALQIMFYIIVTYSGIYVPHTQRGWRDTEGCPKVIEAQIL